MDTAINILAGLTMLLGMGALTYVFVQSTLPDFQNWLRN